jgi:hypothetical protein
MNKIMQARIDVSKIDKSKLYNGKKGIYLDIVLIPTPNSKYADFMIVQSVSKEDREKGIKGNILGNAADIKPNAETTPWADNSNEEPVLSSDDLPF